MSRPLSRRRLLELAGVGGVAAVAAGSGGVLVARGGESTGTGTGGTVPFYGDHQAGILTPQQHHLQFASYDVTASERRRAARPARQLDGPCRPAHPR